MDELNKLLVARNSRTEIVHSVPNILRKKCTMLRRYSYCLNYSIPFLPSPKSRKEKKKKKEIKKQKYPSRKHVKMYESTTKYMYHSLHLCDQYFFLPFDKH